MIRLGLCCKFNEEPISFRTATATHVLKLTPKARAEKLAGICQDNAAALKRALDYCAANGIGSFRVNSQLLPLKTHPRAGYDLKDLPGGPGTVSVFKACGRQAKALGLRLTFHPDQFVLLSSPTASVTAASLLELEYQAEAAEWTGADVINIHGGGAYGDKPAALGRLAAALKRLSRRARARLALENDDRTYSPADLLPFCREHGLPFVYDVHHHRCLPDGLSVEQATSQALATWGGREPLFHLSSPREGWKGSDPRPHHDYIDIKDFPACWRKLNITVEVEAKAKETAIARLRRELGM
ncbi:MAG: UV DNA damage repair endonuclease UvsE [Elusimicrobia bacterium HGW-Elusimicrobia-3]|nr:MAG: UV DNA damage repair endonuclease UvsE [Elusimicrobia bacterium HGW-Elusimicrobia-3]